jgi:gamma-glutamylcyclotransferase
MSVRTQTVYFAYGSNLNLKQMIHRCPESRYLGLGKLQNYKFIINERGYANVVPTQGHSVEGLCYLLSQQDERRLDASEGVPTSYEKHYLRVETFAPNALIAGRRTREVNVIVQNDLASNQGDTLNDGQDGRFDMFHVILPELHNTKAKGVFLQTLVYVDVRYTGDDAPRGEYQNRIRLGARDSIALGISAEYFLENVQEAITRPSRERP